MKIPLVTQDSTEFALTSQQYKLLGLVFGFLGILMFVASYFIASAITTRQAEAVSQMVAQTQECQTRLQSLGYQVSVNQTIITANVSGLDDAAYKLGQASIASLSCQGWSISKFCMGEGCGPKGGVQLELKPTKSPT